MATLRKINNEYKVIDENENILDIKAGDEFVLDNGVKVTVVQKTNGELVFITSSRQEINLFDGDSIKIPNKEQVQFDDKQNNLEENTIEEQTFNRSETNLFDESNLKAQDSQDNDKNVQEDEIQSDSSHIRELDRNGEIKNIEATLRDVQRDARVSDIQVIGGGRQSDDELEKKNSILLDDEAQNSDSSAIKKDYEVELNIPSNEVSESGLRQGTSPDNLKTIANSNFTFKAQDGVQSLEVGGIVLNKEQIEALNNSNQTLETNEGTLVLNGYTKQNDGTISINYTYTLKSNQNHSNDKLTDDIKIKITDNNGSTNTADLKINIIDDSPKANPDTNSITEDSASISNNVFTNDKIGADSTSTPIVGIKAGNDTSSDVNTGVGNAVNGAYGSIVINADGTYTYNLDNTNPKVQNLVDGKTLTETFTYTIKDADGDTSTTTLTITIGGADDGVSINTLPEYTVYEKNLSDGSNPDNSAVNKTGDITFSVNDGLQGGSVNIGGTDFTYAQLQGLNGTQKITTSYGEITLNGFSGNTQGGTISYTYALKDNQTHPNANGTNTVSENIPITIKDSNGSTSSSNIKVSVVDDTPTTQLEAATGATVSLSVDETTLAKDESADFSTLFKNTTVKGADEGVLSSQYTLGVKSNGVDSGLVDTATGQKVLLKVANGKVVGYTQTSNETVFEISVNSSGKVTLDQQRAIVHNDKTSVDESISLNANDLITLSRKDSITDSDGDSDTSEEVTVNVGKSFNFKDDGPSVTISDNVAKIILDESDSVNGVFSTPLTSNTTITATAGADGADSTKSLTYSLILNTGTYDIKTSVGDKVVTLEKVGDKIVGKYNDGTADKEAFVIEISNTGELKVTQKVALEHTDKTNPHDSFDLKNLIYVKVTVTDKDGDEADETISVGDKIVFKDDGPTAVADTNSITEDAAPNTISSNVFTNDKIGADINTSPVTGVKKGSDTSTATTTNVGSAVTGEYGSVVINSDGSYTYTLNNSNAKVQALNNNETLTDTFVYTITDADGDTSTTTLAITINGDNSDVPTINIDSSAAKVYEEALSDGSNSSSTKESVSGKFTISAVDGLKEIVVDGTTISEAALKNSATTPITINSTSDKGNKLVINGYDESTGKVSYTYTLLDNETHNKTTNDTTVTDTISIKVVDTDTSGTTNSATANLVVTIYDDTPTAVADTNFITEDSANVKGNVLTSTNASSNDKADTQGADNSTVTGVVKGTTTPTDGSGTGTSVAGAYGSVVINSDGTYTYTLDNTKPQVQALNNNETLTETFTYMIKDSDGDTSTTTLTITVNGNNNDVPTLNINNTQVYESGLSDGTQASTNKEITTGNFTFKAVDGLKDIVVGGTTLTKAQVEALTTSNTTTIDTGEGTLLLNGYIKAPDGTITVNYKYTLKDDLTHTKPTNDTTLKDIISITINDTDTSGNTNSISGNLEVTIHDDTPTVSISAVTNQKVELDETSSSSTDPNNLNLSATSSTSVVSVAQNYGADGASSANAKVFTLDIVGTGATTLKTAVGDKAITLIKDPNNASKIIGQYEDNGTKKTAFTATIESGGKLTVTQNVALEHNTDGSTATAYDDSLNLSGLINAKVTLADSDGDKSQSSVAIGDKIVFKDDGPTVGVSTTSATEPVLTVDDSDLSTNSTKSFANLFTGTKDAGTDGLKSFSTAYNLAVTNTNSGLKDSLTNKDIMLKISSDGKKVTGYINDSGEKVVFEVSVDANANVTLDQKRAIKQLDTSNNDESISLIDNLITLVRKDTIADNDGDTATNSASINIGANLNFKDDAPSVDNTKNTLVKVYEGDSKSTFNGTGNYNQSDSDSDGSKTSTSTLTHKLDFTAGADGAGITSITFDGKTQSIAVGGSTTITDDDKGTLKVYYDGTWEYTPPATFTHNSPTSPATFDVNSFTTLFTYTVTDNDGDTATGSQSIQVDDTISTSITNSSAELNEKYLNTGTAPNSTKTSVTNNLSIDVSKLKGTHDIKFDATQTDTTLLNSALSSLGEDVHYKVSSDGHTITLYTGSDATNSSNHVMKVAINNPASANPTYTTTLLKAFDHKSNISNFLEDGKLQFDFGLKLYDDDGDFKSSTLIVKVIDDDSPTNQTMSVDEDSTNATANTITTNADATQLNTQIKKLDGSSGQGVHGTASIDSNGKLHYEPKANYSGKDTVYYTTTLDDGTKQTTKVTIDVKPVSDAPTITVDSENISTNEDTKVALGFNAPSVTDNTDQNGSSTAGDDPERLGAITLSGFNTGSKLYNGTTEITPSSTGEVKIQLVKADGTTPLDNHVTDTNEFTNAIKLTVAQFEALEYKPAPHTHVNDSIILSVTEYEVDASGNKLADSAVEGTNGSTTKKTVNIDVKAVTDDLSDLKFTGDKTEETLVINEDGTLNLTSKLLESFGNDTDGSEQYWYELSVLPKGTKVVIAGETKTSDGTNALTFSKHSIGSSTNPEFKITPPTNYSGKIENISVKLNKQDTDSDSTLTTTVSSKTVTLNLHVKPLVDDISVKNVETKEDTAVAFLKDFALTDSDGSEKVTKLVLTDLHEGSVVKYNNTSYTVTSDGKATLGDGTNNLDLNKIKAATITPPSHSSSDMKISITATLKDTATGLSDTVDVKSKTFNLKVTPVAEKVDTDSDSDSPTHNDVTISDNHAFTTHTKEDEWFEIGKDTTSGNTFNLKDGWSNEDDTTIGTSAIGSNHSKIPSGGNTSSTIQTDSEETFAHLTFGEGTTFKAVAGAKFKYNDGTNDITLTDSGSGVDIPVAFLDTVQVLPPKDKSGNYKIKVEAHTVDYDENDGTKIEATSGESFLTFSVDGVADDVTLAVNAAFGKEDAGRSKGNTEDPSDAIDKPEKGIDLDIKVSSSDADTTSTGGGAETFNVEIKDIPAGASLYVWNGTSYVLLDKSSSSLPSGITITPNSSKWDIKIEGFDNNHPPKLVPHYNSDEDFDLKVTAESVENGTTKTVQNPLTLPVTIKEVADYLVQNELKEVPVTDKAGVSHNFNIVKSEADLDGGAKIIVKDAYATYSDVKSNDNDNSEIITFTITGVKADFDVEGGTFLGGTGADRKWLFLTKTALDNAVIKAPTHFSGKIDFKINEVTTEIRGDSEQSFDRDISVFVTPSVDATLGGSAIQKEDEWKELEFKFDSADKDGSENQNTTLTSLSIDLNSLPNGAKLKVDGNLVSGTGYKNIAITGGNIPTIEVLNKEHDNTDYTLKMKYKVKDTITDGTNTYEDEVEKLLNYEVKVNAVTDTPTLDIKDLGNTTNNNIEVTSNGDTFTKTLTVISPDIDGSEKFVRLEISDVPKGIKVENGIFVEDGTSKGTWYVDINPDKVISTATGVNYDLKFTADGSLVNTSNFDNITVKTYIQDENSSDGKNTPAQEEFASQTFGLKINLSNGNNNGTNPADILTFEKVGVPTTVEDIAGGFSLGQFVNVQTSASGEYSVKISKDSLPDGVKLDGATKVGDFWIVSGTGDSNDIKTALDNVKVIPPKDFNTNTATELMNFDLILTTYGTNGQSKKAEINDYDVKITPVTDKMDFDTKDEIITVKEDTKKTITIDLKNSSDTNAQTTIIDGKVYVKATDNDNVLGSLEYSGSTINPTAVSGVTGVPDGNYYVLNVSSSSPAPSSVSFDFTPASNKKGEIKFDVYTKNQETGAANIETSHKTITANVKADPDEISVEIIDGTNNTIEGFEDSLVKIPYTATIPDGDEKIQTVILNKVPDGALVYYGNPSNINANDPSDVSGLTLAQNLGGSWSVPYDSATPANSTIYVLPIKHESSQITGVTMTAISDGGKSATTSVPTTILVKPKADELKMEPTDSIGKEYEWIDINLNAYSKDQDGSEKITVKLTAKTGNSALDDTALFKVDGTVLDMDSSKPSYVQFDSSTKTYSIVGIASDKIGTLQMMYQDYDGTLEVKAQTIDTLAGTTHIDTGAEVTKDLKFSASESFDIKTGAEDNKIVVDNPEIKIDGGAGTDTLILDNGINMDFSKITDGNIKNIEKIDLSRGDHEITNLTGQDVKEMFGGNSGYLEIYGESGDKIELKGWTNLGDDGTHNGVKYNRYEIDLGASKVQVRVDKEIEVIL